MKKNNIWRIIWIIGIYAVLVLILLLVINYKVKWEHKDLNTYLYFYDCSGDVCTSNLEQINYFTKIMCEDDICPYIKEKNDNILVLSNNTKTWLFDYKVDKIINNRYMDYHIINDNYVVTDESGKQGVINYEGEVLVDFNYNLIKEYNNGFFVYFENNKYGIVNEEKNIKIDAQFDDVVLINDSLFAYVKDNKYYVANYLDEKFESNTAYDYLYSDGNVIFVIKDKKIDLLDFNLKSLLILKIDTYYNYEKGQERETLNIDSNGSYLTFSIIIDDNNNIRNYLYDINNKKLF